MRQLAYQAARLTGALSRRLGRGGGTSLPGMLLLKLRPEAAGELARGFRHGVITISATNGKTSTARLVASMLDRAGWTVVANSAGANLMTGVTTALVQAPTGVDAGLFEVDEAALPEVARQTRPRIIVLMNLFRDQLDRFGELETLVDTWRTMLDQVGSETMLVINADDPALVGLGLGRDNVLWFGVNDPGVGRSELAHAADSTHCPTCNSPLTYSLITIGHLGHWSCTSCGLHRPAPQVAATAIKLEGLTGSSFAITTPATALNARVGLPGLHNVYNAVAAAAVGVAAELQVDAITAGIAATDAAFGRAETISLNGRSIVILLAKNPAGANENIRTAALHDQPIDALVLLNDKTADGQDVSWIWDVDYETLFDRLHSLTLGGLRSGDLALRFRYGGLDPEVVEQHQGVAAAFDRALARTPKGGTLFVLPTYTAMLELRELLVERGVTHAFWEDR